MAKARHAQLMGSLSPYEGAEKNDTNEMLFASPVGDFSTVRSFVSSMMSTLGLQKAVKLDSSIACLV